MRVPTAVRHLFKRELKDPRTSCGEFLLISAMLTFSFVTCAHAQQESDSTEPRLELPAENTREPGARNTSRQQTLDDSLHGLMTTTGQNPDSAAAALSPSDSARKDSILSLLGPGTDRDTSQAPSVIRTPRQLSYESMVVIEVALNEYLSSKTKMQHYDVGGSGVAVGFLFPLKIPFAMLYYHAKATFHWAVPDTAAILNTLITATNEIRLGVPFTIQNIPFEYSPMAGIGLNNAVIGYTNAGGNIRGGYVEYYFHYMLGISIRQPFYIKKQCYSMGLTADFERAFAYEDATKQRLVAALLLGL